MSPTASKPNTKKASRTSRKSGSKTAGSSGSNLKGKSLIIVESPTKARTLGKYLDSLYVIKASGGHVIDLPQKDIGVDIEAGFKPQYKVLPGKAKIVKDLTTAATNADQVFLATDPDREGEAIAWHISNQIAKKSKNNIWRIQFHEITKKAVLEALESPGEIDMAKVDAQQARRVMDRLVGYQVSPLLWKTIKGGLSAGRVQSVALRLICEREEVREAFLPEQYWTIDGIFEGESVDPFVARLVKFQNKKVGTGSSLLKISDFKDTPKLIHLFFTHPNPVLKYIKGKFSERTDLLLNEFNEKKIVAGDLEESLVADLNRIIKTEKLFDREIPGDFSLSNEIDSIIKNVENVSEEGTDRLNVVYLNRLLLDEVLSGSIVSRFLIPDQRSAGEIKGTLESAAYRILEIEKTRKKRQPYPPYITSTLQQDAGRRLGNSVKRTMALAQRLYEGVELGDRGSVGLITYMRTDSTRVSMDAVTAARNWIGSNKGEEYLTPKPRFFKNKKGAVQDAHEAIRPTDVELTPEVVKPFLQADEYKLYELIWKRFIATQMSVAQMDVTVITVGDGIGIEFKATGQVIVFPGFLAVYKDIENKNGNNNGDQALPLGLTVNMPLTLVELKDLIHFTQPLARFNEASLVKELDELGIGRPSTYASIISTIQDRDYVEKIERAFSPTELGKTVNRILVSSFPDIFNVEFTAQMEDKLDLIETGEPWQEVLNKFYTPFSNALQIANERRSELREKTHQPVGRECPGCGNDLIYRWGRHGRFISCKNYPDCKYSENINNISASEPTDVECPKCGKPMVIRAGRYGRFYGCSAYPKCRGILPLLTKHSCPEEDCKGTLTEKKTQKGKIFFSCNKYPECKFSSWDAPADGTCPECDAPTIFEKKSKATSGSKYCHRCGWKMDI